VNCRWCTRAGRGLGRLACRSKTSPS
jgi:hypothetical protein